MSDRVKAALVLVFMAQFAVALLWERIFPVHIRTEREYRQAMDDLDKLVNAFEEKLTTRVDEQRIKELADAIVRYDERKLTRKPE